MHQIQVEVIRPQVRERLVNRTFDILGKVMGIPQLRRQPDGGAGDARVANPGADFCFIGVAGGGVDVAVSDAKGFCDGVLDLAGFGLLIGVLSANDAITIPRWCVVLLTQVPKPTAGISCPV